MIDFARVRTRSMEPSLIPFINIIFLLLIFFMVAGRVEQMDTVNVDLPEVEHKKHSSPLPEKHEITVYLGRDGTIAVNQDYVAKDDFVTIIRTLLLEHTQAKIVMKADTRLDARILLQVMNMLDEAGATSVVILANTNQHTSNE